MATTPVGFDTREIAIAAVLALRLKMNQVLEQIVGGNRTLSAVLQPSDELALNQLYVVKVLESFSDIGKIRARQTLDEVGISYQQKLECLSDQQRTQLLEVLR